MSMVNLELYRVFYTVAKCGSLTKAAQDLYISQPAVSQSVKQLERQLGFALFNRTHRGMELTQTGKIVYKYAEKALELIESAESKIAELNNSPSGTIKIGATDSIFSHLLSDKIAQYNEKYPSVKIELISSTSPETLEKLKSGSCDVAFVNLPIQDDGVKFLGKVATLNDIFVAGNKFSALKDKEISLKNLQDFPLLMIEQKTVAREFLSSYLLSLGVELSPDIEVANWDFMLKLAVKGMGIGCIPREYCFDLIASGDLFEIKVSPSLPARGVGIAVQKNIPASFALKCFIEMFLS